MNDLYAKYARDYSTVIQDNIFNALYDRPSLLSLVQGQKFASCLDLGCGPGAYIPSLQKFCKTVTSVDLSPEFIRIVAEKYPEVRSYVWDLSKGLPKEKSNSYDLVISPLSVHYIEDLQFLFSEVSRVLKIEGIFAFSTHHPMQDFSESVSGNYFECEKLTQMWDTIPGKMTQVSFFRRPLSKLLGPLLSSGFVIDGISEGQPDLKIKERAPEIYRRLTTKTQFIFFRARKTS